MGIARTLYGMFPNLDREIIDDVVREKKGRYDDFRSVSKHIHLHLFTGLV